MIKIEIKEEYAYKIVHFLGCQNIRDTRAIVDKYNLGYSEQDYEQALQNLFDKLSCELEIEF